MIDDLGITISIALSPRHFEALLREVTADLAQATAGLEIAILQAGAATDDRPSHRKRVSHMAVPQILADLELEVTNARTVMGGAATLIRGFEARMNAAVEAALANGATAEELAPITDEVAGLHGATEGLSAAVASVPPAPGGEATT